MNQQSQNKSKLTLLASTITEGKLTLHSLKECPFLPQRSQSFTLPLSVFLLLTNQLQQNFLRKTERTALGLLLICLAYLFIKSGKCLPTYFSQRFEVFDLAFMFLIKVTFIIQLLFFILFLVLIFNFNNNFYLNIILKYLIKNLFIFIFYNFIDIIII